jgi:ABC-type sulfate transport system substrate-binding protein
MNFHCTTTSGGGTEQDAGIWELKETPKTITLTLIEEPFFEPNYKEIKVKKETKNLREGNYRYHGFGDVLIDWEDKTFTAYPKQCGTPYYFKPI